MTGGAESRWSEFSVSIIGVSDLNEVADEGPAELASRVEKSKFWSFSIACCRASTSDNTEVFARVLISKDLSLSCWVSSIGLLRSLACKGIA